MRKTTLIIILAISITIVVILNFFEELRFSMWPITKPDADNINRLLEVVSLAFITSYLFYFIVNVLKERGDKKNAHIILRKRFEPFINELCSICRDNNNHNAPFSVEELLTTKIPEFLREQDLNEISPGTEIVEGKLVGISWIQWLHKINNRFIKNTNDVFIKYSTYLDSGTSLQYEELRITNYTTLLNSASLMTMNNINNLSVDEKFKVHHEILYKMFETVFKGKKTEIVFEDDRFRLNIK